MFGMICQRVLWRGVGVIYSSLLRHMYLSCVSQGLRRDNGNPLIFLDDCRISLTSLGATFAAGGRNLNNGQTRANRRTEAAGLLGLHKCIIGRSVT
eukprot:scaffold1202_cov228-Pinguiococcus_pyrenoidosus.AAC.3